MVSLAPTDKISGHWMARCLRCGCLRRRPRGEHKEINYFGMRNLWLRGRLYQFDRTISQKANAHGGVDRVLHGYRDYKSLAISYMQRCGIANATSWATSLKPNTSAWQIA